jgi:hypothetical protein
MRIKEPNSDNALESLMNEIDHAHDRLTNCISRNHDITAVLYFSSLVIMPDVVFNGRKLLDEISNTISVSPNCICVVRTTTPTYFPGHMRTRHKRAVDFLRNKCYVILYSKKTEFLNHAKFFIHYHVCQSEGNVHYGHFYGSTNLTQIGLGNPRNKGNYEEFEAYHSIKYKLSWSDKEYLKEVLELIIHKASLYTNRRYLAGHILDHERQLENLLGSVHSSEENSDPTLNEFYESYVNLMVEYSQTFAMLDEIPGKRITNRIIEKLTQKTRPPDPLELEMMYIDPKYAESAAGDLGLSIESLMEAAERYKVAATDALTMLRNEYEPFIDKISDYFDEDEIKFSEFLKENNEKHVYSLRKIIESQDK